jgi:hypothetical protein
MTKARKTRGTAAGTASKAVSSPKKPRGTRGTSRSAENEVVEKVVMVPPVPAVPQYEKALDVVVLVTANSVPTSSVSNEVPEKISGEEDEDVSTADTTTAASAEENGQEEEKGFDGRANSMDDFDVGQYISIRTYLAKFLQFPSSLVDLLTKDNEGRLADWRKCFLSLSIMPKYNSLINGLNTPTNKTQTCKVCKRTASHVCGLCYKLCGPFADAVSVCGGCQFAHFQLYHSTEAIIQDDPSKCLSVGARAVTRKKD